MNILNPVLGFGLSPMLEVSREKSKVGNLLEFTTLRALRPSFFPLLSVLVDVAKTEDSVDCVEVVKTELDVLKFKSSIYLDVV